MKHEYSRHLRTIVTCLACALGSACRSEGPAALAGSGVHGPAGSLRGSATSSQASVAPASKRPKKTKATGPERLHPFLPVIDARPTRASLAGKTGPLHLSGILDGSVRVAIIQEGKNTHLVRVGDVVGNMAVVDIREAEVVVGAGQHKRVLALYER